MSAPPAHKIRIGIPYRTKKEELSNKRDAYDKYLAAVKSAGAEPVEISLGLTPEELQDVALTLDAVVLSGSPADVEPSLFHAARNPKTANPTPLANAPILRCSIMPSPNKSRSSQSATACKVSNVFLGGSAGAGYPQRNSHEDPARLDGSRRSGTAS